MAKQELTVSNFKSNLRVALQTRFHPMNVEARLTEVSNTLRSIIGESAWEHELLNKRDIATLYAVIEGRKLKIPASEDPDSHNTQHWLGKLVKDTGQKFGMREYDFEDQKLVNWGAVNMLLSAEPERTIRATDFDAIVSKYDGPDTRHALIDPDLLPPENPLVIKRKPEPKPRAKPEPKAAKPLTPKEPSTRAFENRWDALQVEADAQEMDADGITCFIADGQKQALALSPEAFQERCETAKKVMKQVGVESPKAERLLDEIAAAHTKYHENRALGGIKRD